MLEEKFNRHYKRHGWQVAKRPWKKPEVKLPWHKPEVKEVKRRIKEDIGASFDIADLNKQLTQALSTPYLTPYIALEKCRHIVAPCSIQIPMTFLEGDDGKAVIEIFYFAQDTPYFLYLTYRKNPQGMYDVTCRLVTGKQLEKLAEAITPPSNIQRPPPPKRTYPIPPGRMKPNTDPNMNTGMEIGGKFTPNTVNIAHPDFSRLRKRGWDDMIQSGRGPLGLGKMKFLDWKRSNTAPQQNPYITTKDKAMELPTNPAAPWYPKPKVNI